MNWLLIDYLLSLVHSHQFAVRLAVCFKTFRRLVCSFEGLNWTFMYHYCLNIYNFSCLVVLKKKKNETCSGMSRGVVWWNVRSVVSVEVPAAGDSIASIAVTWHHNTPSLSLSPQPYLDQVHNGLRLPTTFCAPPHRTAASWVITRATVFKFGVSDQLSLIGVR